MPDSLQILSPGRVCLFGDHQDYLQLPVIACAINRFLKFEGRPNDTANFSINLLDTSQHRELSLYETRPHNSHDYWVSGLNVLRRTGLVFTRGYHLQVSGNIPINAGLSSSSALVVGWLRFLCAAAGFEPQAAQLARWAYETEVLEFNQPGGLMDQYTISIGNIIYIDTRPPSAFQRLGHELKGMVVAESGIPKSTLGTLGKLREMAQKAVSFIQTQMPDFNLHQAEPEEAKALRKCLPSNLQDVFLAAVENHSITRWAVKVFEDDPENIEKLGYLMSLHHAVLRDKLNITVPEIDVMINTALKAGAFGAKIVGSGGGGCIVALADAERQGAVVEALKKVSKAAYAVSVSEGAKLLKT